MSGNLNFRLEAGLPRQPREELLQRRKGDGLRREAQRFTRPLPVGLAESLLEADGLLASKGLEVAGAGICLETRERLAHRVEGRLAPTTRPLQVAQIVALDALILRVQFRHQVGPV